MTDNTLAPPTRLTRAARWWMATPGGETLSATGAQAASRLGCVSWAMFEGARNPHVLLVTIYLFAPYFAQHIVGDPVKGQTLWGNVHTMTGLIISFTAPFLGAIADAGGRRKPWLVFFSTILAAASFLLWHATPGADETLLTFVVAILVISFLSLDYTAVFHNSMLPAIAPPHRVASLSGLALALGNGSGVLLLLFMLIAFALPGVVDWPFVPAKPWFGIDQSAHEHERLAGPIFAIWFILFALPLFFFTPDVPKRKLGPLVAISRGVISLWRTVIGLHGYRNIALYLVARMIYNDGKTAVLLFGGIYAAGVFHWEALSMLVYGIVLSIFATFGGVIGGWLDDKFGSKRAILISIGGTMMGLLLSISMTPDSIFFYIPYDTAQPPVHSLPFFKTWPEIIYVALVILIAIFITAAYANSRTMLARMAPPEKMTEFFGLYALSGSATAWLAPFVVGRFTEWFESQRIGMAAILLMLGIGFAMMFFVKEERVKLA